MHQPDTSANNMQPIPNSRPAFVVAINDMDCSNTQQGGRTLNFAGKEKKMRSAKHAGFPVGCTSPPIRNGTQGDSKEPFHNPPLSTEDHVVLQLVTKKNDERKASQRNIY